jgi:site-specific DNA recombinase
LTACQDIIDADRRAAKAELDKLTRERERLIQAIKDGIPAAEIKDDLARIAARREELEALIEGTTEEPVLLHPNLGQLYRQQVGRLVEALNDEHHRKEAAEIIRGLVDRIELTPKEEKGARMLSIELHGALAGILSLATNGERPLQHSGLSVQEITLVAGACNTLCLLLFATRRIGWR